MHIDTLPAPSTERTRFFASTALLMISAIVLVTRHVDWHRRLMYIAALCLVAPALTRWTLKLPLANSLLVDLMAYFLVTFPFLIALGAHDRRVLGRIHAATRTGAALVLPLQLSSPWIARSAWWNRLAPALLG